MLFRTRKMQLSICTMCNGFFSLISICTCGCNVYFYLIYRPSLSFFARARPEQPFRSEIKRWWRAIWCTWKCNNIFQIHDERLSNRRRVYAARIYIAPANGTSWTINTLLKRHQSSEFFHAQYLLSRISTINQGHPVYERDAAAAATLLTNGSQEIRLLPTLVFFFFFSFFSADLNAPADEHTMKIYIKFRSVITNDFFRRARARAKNALKSHECSSALKAMGFPFRTLQKLNPATTCWPRL